MNGNHEQWVTEVLQEGCAAIGPAKTLICEPDLPGAPKARIAARAMVHQAGLCGSGSDDEALRGCQIMSFLPTPWPSWLIVAQPIFVEAVDQVWLSIRRKTFSSSGLDEDCRICLAIESKVINDILRELAHNSSRSIREEGSILSASDDGKIGFISADDIADDHVAFDALTRTESGVR
ncbi:hypothetical protein BDZ89DRAFT_1034716 [Hymenopellis radicata]|nr:hypothetical protein BDZ89DRAFT_1034716 [Hymenopellis radicata]